MGALIVTPKVPLRVLLNALGMRLEAPGVHLMAITMSLRALKVPLGASGCNW